MTADEKLQRLKDILKHMESVVIGFSGGVDSTFLTKVAQETLGEKVLAVTATSVMHSKREIKEAVEFAEVLHINHMIVPFEPLKVMGFAENPKERCYICKKALFSKVKDIAEENGYNYVVDGANVDDTGDYRPGMIAVKELGIRSPLLEAGFTKNDIRILSKSMNLPTWDKPSFACFSSRIPYGEKITEEKLSMIGASEEYLFDIGFRQVRVRHHGDLARIEVSPEERQKFFDFEVMDRVSDKLREIGFNYVTLDLKGYRTGSMNEVLKE